MSTWATIAAADLDDYLVAAQVTAIRTAALGAGQSDTFNNVSHAVIDNVRQQIRNNFVVSATAYSVPPESKANVCWLILAALQPRLPGLRFTEEQKSLIEEARTWLKAVAKGEFSVSEPADPETTHDAQSPISPAIVERTLTYTRDDQDEFDGPNPFSEALAFLRDKELMPTPLSSQLSLLDKEVRRKSLFSARTTSAAYLQRAQGTLDKMLTGKIEMATAKAELQDALDELGYTPQFGFAPGTVPPAEPGDLQDLSSDARTKLVIETNFRQAANYGTLVQGSDDLSLFQFPAWELVRIYTRREERQNWPERFVRAGGQLWEDRMIALKGDAVWSNLGSSELFTDGIDADFPPYAFNSGMGWRAVDRDECLRLGIIRGDQSPAATARPAFDAGMDENLGIFSNDFLAEVVNS